MNDRMDIGIQLRRHFLAMADDLPAEGQLDGLLTRTAATPQRPGWTYIERWFPMSALTERLATTPRFPMRLVAAALIALALVAGALFIVGNQPKKLPPPFGPAANGQLVYAVDGDIYVRDALSEEPRLLIGGPGKDDFPGYSPRGTHLNFWRNVDAERPLGIVDDQPRHDELWVASADGTEPRKVGGPYENVLSFDWSPDESRIVVSFWPTDDVPTADIVRTDGSAATPMRTGVWVMQPTFRPPDGKQILYRGIDPAGRGQGLYLGTLDENDQLPLGSTVRLDLATQGVNQGNDDFGGASWSPDGTRLLFNAVQPVKNSLTGHGSRIHLAHVDPDGRVTAQRTLEFDASVRDESDAVWLPTGDGFLFVSWNEDIHELMIGSLDGGRATPTGVDNVHAFGLLVSPDGTRALARAGLNDYMVDLAGGTATKVPFMTDSGLTWQRVAAD